MMKVRIHWINEGTPSAYCFLAAFDDEDSCRPLHYAPHWKTERGARRWAEKHGYQIDDSDSYDKMADMVENIRCFMNSTGWEKVEEKPRELLYMVKESQLVLRINICTQLVHYSFAKGVDEEYIFQTSRSMDHDPYDVGHEISFMAIAIKNTAKAYKEAV